VILKQYISDTVTNVLAITFFVVALLSFGYAEYFDRLFIAFLLGASILNIKNANVLSIALIFLFERSIEEIIFFSSTLSFIKPLIYLLSLYVMRKLWYDGFVKRFVLPTIVVCIVCEVYWYLTGYNAPRIHSYIAMLMLNMITRHLIFMRVPLFKSYQAKLLGKKTFSVTLQQTSVDLPLYSLAMGNALVVIAILAEYLVRHLTSFNPLVIYDLYPYMAHLLTTATLFFITLLIIKSNPKLSA